MVKEDEQHEVAAKFCFNNYLKYSLIYSQEPKGMTVVTGTNLLSEGGDSYDAETLIVHPGYLAFTITNDIALIKLKDPIKYGEKVSNIKLPTKDTTAKTQLTLSGWGTTTYPGKAPDKLQAIQLISISNLKCMMEHPLHVIVNTNLCTFTKTGEGACHVSKKNISFRVCAFIDKIHLIISCRVILVVH